MELFHDPLVDGWTVEGVLTEIALKHGLSLGFSVEKVAMAAAEVYRLVDAGREQAIYVSLDDHLDLDALNGLDLNADDVFICRDAALDDETAANLALQCRLETI